MELLPELRPMGPTIEHSSAAARERDSVEASSEPGRFEEHLSQVSGRRAELEGRARPSRSEDSASRTRPMHDEETRPERPEKPAGQPAEVGAEREASPELPDSAQATTAPKTNQDPGFEKLHAASADGAQGVSAPTVAADPAAVQAADDSQSNPLPEAQPAASKLTPAADAALAAALGAAQAKPQEAPSLHAVAGTAALAATIVSASETASLAPKLLEEPSPEPNAIKNDSSAKVTPDASLRANLGAGELPRDFERELVQVRDALDSRAFGAERAHAARESAAEILRQVRVGLSSDLREANIQLAPESLGRVSIRLRVEHGVVTADVRAETSQALRALEMHAPELKAALASHTAEARSPEFSFSLMNSHTGDAPARGHASPSGSPRAGQNSFELAPVQVERALARHLSASGVDTYA